SYAKSATNSTLLRVFFDLIRQAFFPQILQLRCAVTSRQNLTIADFELRRSPHLRRSRAQPLQHRGVRFKIALNGENSNFHSPTPRFLCRVSMLRPCAQEKNS